MKINLFLITALSTVLLASALPSEADTYGLGGYITGGYGTTTRKSSHESNHLKNSCAGFGFIMYLSLDQYDKLNYRLHAGYKHYPDFFNNNGRQHRAETLHTVSIGLFSTDYLRFWVGPQLGIHFISGKSDASYFDSPLLLFNITHAGIYRDTSCMGGISIGITTGINFKVRENMTIGIEGGIYNDISGGTVMRETRSLVMAGSAIIPLNKKSSFKILNYGWETYLSFSVLYRVPAVVLEIL